MPDGGTARAQRPLTGGSLEALVIGGGRSSRPARAILVTLVAAATIWALLLRPVFPLDFRVFYSAGRAVVHGHNPYPLPTSPAVWSGTAFVYPYVAACVFSTLAGLGLHAATALWTALSLCSIVGGTLLLAGLRWGVLVAVLAASPTIDGLQMGTLNAFLFLGIAATWRWRRRPIVVGALVGLLIAMKLFLWPLGLWLLLTRDWRAARSAAVLALGLLGVGFIVGPVGPSTYLHLLTGLGAHEIARTSGLQGLLVAWGADPPMAEAIGVLTALVTMAIVARLSNGAPAAMFAACIAAALLASPIVWHHYYLMLAAPLLITQPPAKAAVWYVLTGWASLPPHTAAGISLVGLTAIADVALALVVLRALVVHRFDLARTLGRRWPVTTAIATAIPCLLACAVWEVGWSRLGHGVTQAGVPLGTTLAMTVAAVARRRCRPRRALWSVPPEAPRRRGESAGQCVRIASATAARSAVRSSRVPLAG